MPAPRPKRILARVLSVFPHSLLVALQRSLVGGRMLRAVNYHRTPAHRAADLRRHLEFFRRHYANVGPAELEAFLSSGAWAQGRPGLILTFDDGYRDNAIVAAPLLEEFGFTGWFMIPSDLVTD